jgi:hypothetical protein
MSHFNPTQLDDLNQRTDTLLRQMRAALGDEVDSVGVRAVMEGIRRLTMTYGGPGAAHVARAWCDQLVANTPGAVPGKAVTVAAVAGPDCMIPPQFILPDRRWAIDLITARFSDDQVRLYLLLEDGLAGDNATMRLFRLVELVASQLDAYENPRQLAMQPGLYRADQVTPGSLYPDA